MAMNLAQWHKRLECHFRVLSAHRKSRFQNRQIFGLEHGLDISEIRALMTAVRAHIADGPPAWDHALAWIVYASEIGYGYSGNEYWQTFEEETPGWTIYGDRYWIRDCFRWFQEEFNGVEPGGTWAKHFSIICWPITHAILPTDLQRQLARILYEVRHFFSAELFEFSSELPSKFGDLIALHSWNATSRFQNLVQEPQLLGQIATALLLQGEFGTEHLIHPMTLSRIGKDLDRERRAREWLRGARSVATERVQIRGLKLPDQVMKPSISIVGNLAAARAEVAKLGIEPRLVLRPTDSTNISWEVSLEIPNLSHLIIRFPQTKDILTGSRCVVTGAAGRPLARGRCLHGAQRVTLAQWPLSDEVLLRFEQTNPELEYLLRTECLLRPGSTWLFRIASDGLAYECRSLRVRPGERYIMVSTTGPVSSNGHAIPINLSCQGAYGAILDIPLALDEDWEETLRHLGLGQRKTIEVWPAGLSAVVWDGEGHGEWLASECPCLGIQTDHSLAHLMISMETNENLCLDLTPVMPGEPTFIEFPNLSIGLHTVRISAQNSLTEEAELIGDLDVVIRIRDERSWAPGESSRGPLMVYMEPSAPTLEQIWEGRVDVTIRGPANRVVKCRVSFFERDGNVATVTKQLPPIPLPVTADKWRDHFEKCFRKTEVAKNFYDTTRICELDFTADELGAFKVRCERDFTPLRWAIRRRSQGYFIRLLDDIGADAPPEVTHMAFETPCIEEKIEITSEYDVPETGGLYVARMYGFMAGIIVPPMNIKGLVGLGCRSNIEGGPRSKESIIRTLQIASLWGSARLPGNIISTIRQQGVLEAFACFVASLLGGDTWAKAEIDASKGDSSMELLQKAISKRQDEQEVGLVLARDYVDLALITCNERVKRFASLASKCLLLHSSSSAHELSVEWISELALRLASDPAGVKAWAGERLGAGLERLMEAPTTARAARFLVLAINKYHTKSQLLPGQLYAGWRWA
ncbi:MAG: hypothetical protein WBM02_10280 [bacterium]